MDGPLVFAAGGKIYANSVKIAEHSKYGTITR
jgi:hypothetical protein